MSDEPQPLPSDEDNQQAAGATAPGADAPVPRRPRRVRGYAASGTDLSQVNAFLSVTPPSAAEPEPEPAPEPAAAGSAAPAGNPPDEAEAASPEAAAGGTE